MIIYLVFKHNACISLFTQLLGIDVLIDRKLRPHLLEVNAHPSLRIDFEQPVKPGVVEYIPSPVDMAIKLPVVRDSLKIIAAKLKGYVMII